MKQSFVILALVVAAGGAQARVASPAAPASAAVADAQPGTPQRSKMKACNAEAKSKAIHGADRRAFMKQCLSSKAKASAAS